MDESWRIPIGSVVPRRRSTEQTRRFDVGGLGPDDFRDVFGGPPRTVLLRQFSGGDIASPSSSSSSFSTASYFDRLHRSHQSGASRRRPSFYEEVFRGQCPESHQVKIGRSLPDFMIPSATPGGRARRADDDEFHDIFGWESERRSRTRSRQSKSNSSSVLSSEDHNGGEPACPHRPWPADDGALTSFASKLRPITIPCRRGDARSPASPEEEISRTTTVPSLRPSLVELGFEEEYVVAGTRADGSCKLFRPYQSETIVSVEWTMPVANDEDDSGSGSFSSAISSIYDVPMATIRPAMENHEKEAPEAPKDIVMALEEEEEGADGSYVIEFMPGGKASESEGSSAAAALDEAIAWAKEKFRGASLPEGIGAGEDRSEEARRRHAHACAVAR